jgi:hypothetical protein
MAAAADLLACRRITNKEKRDTQREYQEKKDQKAKYYPERFLVSREKHFILFEPKSSLYSLRSILSTYISGDSLPCGGPTRSTLSPLELTTAGCQKAGSRGKSIGLIPAA